MQINQAQANHIVAIYFEGGYDSEIESYLMTEGFPIGYFASEYENNPKFKLLIDACRIHARAFWERLLRQNVGNKSFNVPAWLNAVKGQGMTQYEDKKQQAPSITVNINEAAIDTAHAEYIERQRAKLITMRKGDSGTIIDAD